MKQLRLGYYLKIALNNQKKKNILGIVEIRGFMMLNIIFSLITFKKIEY